MFDQDEVAFLRSRVHDLECEVERLQRVVDPTFRVSFVTPTTHPNLRLVWSKS